MARFLNGLKHRDYRQGNLQPYSNIEELLHITIKIERQIQRRFQRYSSKTFSNSNSTWKNDSKNIDYKHRNQEMDEKSHVNNDLFWISFEGNVDGIHGSMKYMCKLRQELDLQDQVRERQIVQPIQKEEDCLISGDNVSNDDIVTRDVETYKDSMQVYVAPYLLETKCEESEKEKECEEEIFGK